MIENKHNLSTWYVETDSQRLRRFGKTLEELGELQAVVARCIIQGIDEIDPSSGKVNRKRLEEEIADVDAQLGLLVYSFNLDQQYIHARSNDKVDQMHTWESLVAQEDRLVEEQPSDDWQPSSDWTYSGD